MGTIQKEPKAPKEPKLTLSDVATYRRALGKNQGSFWGRFFVTQSGGSRYENRGSIPRPTQVLMALYAEKVITDEDIDAVAKKYKI